MIIKSSSYSKSHRPCTRRFKCFVLDTLCSKARHLNTSYKVYLTQLFQSTNHCKYPNISIKKPKMPTNISELLSLKILLCYPEVTRVRTLSQSRCQIQSLLAVDMREMVLKQYPIKKLHKTLGISVSKLSNKKILKFSRCIVKSRTRAHLIWQHPRIFSQVMKGKFDVYLLRPFG